MMIRFDEKLRELRKARGNTQEELANCLGVTVQAVSKWERCEGMPDIMYLPQIAGFYGVTVDTLLGVDEAAKAARQEELHQEYLRIMHAKKMDDGTVLINGATQEEGIAHLRAALQELPGNWFFMRILADNLWIYAKSPRFDGNEAERIKLLDEAEELCRKILKESMDDQMRDYTSSTLCHVLYEQGNKQQAVALAESMQAIPGTREWLLTDVLDGEALEAHLNQIICELAVHMSIVLEKMKDKGFSMDTLRENKRLRQQLDEIMRTIYG